MIPPYAEEIEKIKKLEQNKRPDWRVVLLCVAVVCGHVIVNLWTNNILTLALSTIVTSACFYALSTISTDIRRGAAMQETVVGVMKVVTGQLDKETASKPKTPSVTTKAPAPVKFPFPKAGGGGSTFEGFPE